VNKVFVGVITYKRPEGLYKLLTSLCKVKLQPGFELFVLVADNDSSESARKITDSFESLKIIYAVESKQGIPYARNKILDMVPLDAEYLIMVDDDEIVSENWLIELIAYQIKFKATAVLGSVYPIFSTPVDSLLNDFFTKTPYKDGEDVKYGSTCNVLLKCSEINAMGLRFDERMRFTGGSDTLFFMNMLAAGGIFKFASKATVHEYIPESRAKYDWIKKRSFREGVTYVISNRYFKKNNLFIFSLKIFPISFIAVIILFLPTLLSGIFSAKSNRFSLKFYRRLGVVAATLGISFEEYK
jgi:glycosyltransferase involved in cell wall biosynthesis